jgi:serine/threonine-protein kinase
LWLLPLLSKNSGLFLGAFLILGIISAQPVLLILKGIWFPSINLLLLMLIGQISVYVYVSGQSILDDLLRKEHDAWYQLGHYQFERNEYEIAITSLLKCNGEAGALADLYEIGLKFERKRQYDRAYEIYSEISKRRKNYKDVERRLKTHGDISSKSSASITPPAGQKSLLMSHVELPEFGRYAIEKELGRGAMGVVT